MNKKAKIYNITKAIIITLTLAYTELSAQSKEFKDLVILKDGTVLNGVQTTVTKDSVEVLTSVGQTTTYSKKDVSEVIKRAFDPSKGYKDLVILNDGTLMNALQTLVTKDSLLVSSDDGQSKIYKKSEVSEVKKGVFDKTKGFKDTVKLKDGTLIEPAQTLVNKDSLLVFTADGTAAIYSKKDVSDVKKNSYTKPIAADPKLASSWSAYQGKLNWEDAKAKCASIGMKLPSIEELKAAYAAEITKSWDEIGFLSNRFYWSSQLGVDNRAYILGVLDGGSNEFNRSSEFKVRCLR